MKDRQRSGGTATEDDGDIFDQIAGGGPCACDSCSMPPEGNTEMS